MAASVPAWTSALLTSSSTSSSSSPTKLSSFSSLKCHPQLPRRTLGYRRVTSKRQTLPIMLQQIDDAKQGVIAKLEAKSSPFGFSLVCPTKFVRPPLLLHEYRTHIMDVVGIMSYLVERGPIFAVYLITAANLFNLWFASLSNQQNTNPLLTYAGNLCWY